MTTKPPASKTPDAIDLDFTGVFNFKDLRRDPPPPPAAPPPKPLAPATKVAGPAPNPPALAPKVTGPSPKPPAPVPAPVPAPKAIAPSPPPVSKETLVGVSALDKHSYYVNMARPRPKRNVDPAKTTVLLVEDDASTRDILNFILTRSEGYLTRQADDVKSFVAALQIKPLPDVVILDVELPGGVSGFKILEKIRAHPVIGNMPVIIFSGYSDPTDLQQGLLLGVDAYLSKPAKAEAIIAAVKAVLGG